MFNVLEQSWEKHNRMTEHIKSKNFNRKKIVFFPSSIQFEHETIESEEENFDFVPK